jgi:hypothetical protein
MPRLTCHSVARGSDAVMAARRLAQPSGAESRPIVDKAAVAVGRDSADVDTICKVSGRLTGDPLPRTRDDNGSWIGGGLTQWVEELTFAVLERRAAAFIYSARSWRKHQRYDTEPLGIRGRPSRPRSNR